MILGFIKSLASLTSVPSLLKWYASTTVLIQVCNCSGVLLNKKIIIINKTYTKFITEIKKNNNKIYMWLISGMLTCINNQHPCLPIHPLEWMHLWEHLTFPLDLQLWGDISIFWSLLALISADFLLKSCINDTICPLPVDKNGINIKHK